MRYDDDAVTPVCRLFAATPGGATALGLGPCPRGRFKVARRAGGRLKPRLKAARAATTPAAAGAHPLSVGPQWRTL